MNSGSGRRQTFIHEMGIGPIWKKREAPGAHAVEAHTEIKDLPAEQKIHEEPVAAYRLEEGREAVKPPVTMEESAIPEATVIRGKAPSAAEIALMDWSQLRENVAGCVKCRLCETRTKTVFGVGDEKARWLFVGEGPGRNEDAKGEPFVGPAGKLLDNMLLSLGLRRGENAYIANTVKCRPIGEDGRDRPPAPDEAEACLPYLERQIALIKPTVIVALGKTAALSLLKLPADTPVTKLRGKVHQYHDLPLVVTYHPAYLLRKLTDKGKAWSDLCLAMNTYASTHQ